MSTAWVANDLLGGCEMNKHSLSCNLLLGWGCMSTAWVANYLFGGCEMNKHIYF